MIRFLLFQSFFTLFLITNFSQVITVGNGVLSNGATSYPAPYGNYYHGAKHQIIIRASELNASGMTAGDISSLAFNVEDANGVAMNNFSIALKLTSQSEWTTSSDFETGLTTVFSNSSYTESLGWNIHSFTTPFYWDGVSNLLIETCFNNTNYTNNASTYYSNTSFSSVLYTRRDQSTVCSTIQNNFNFSNSSNRPNIRFEWQAPNLPPETDFISSSTSSCSGQISFFDESIGSPTSWLWSFGDGSSSTLQNPTHNYNNTGTYTVSLTSTNQFGTTTETKMNYINVNLSGVGPVASSCIPITQDGSLGFGITNVSFNTINESSGDASEGYTDNTCSQTTVFAGQDYPIAIEHSSPTFHNCAVWIDYNNNGVFEEPQEKVISSTSSLTTVGDVTISSQAILNTPLRMRVFADYDLSNPPNPCLDPTYGQVEDYTVYVALDSNPPTPLFSSDIEITCDGEIQFSDLSTNVPTSWLWDFGDGNNSIQQSPSHVYNSNGVYTVTLTVTNQFGSTTITKPDLITVNLSNQLLSAQCMPQTLSHCCGYGVYKVKFNTNGFENNSVGAEEGYQDFSCVYNDSVEGGSSYPIEVRTGSNNPQDTRIWIDYNNDGVFDFSEMVLEALNQYNPSGSVNIPSSNIQWNTPLRFRVLSDEVGSSLNPCSDLTRGQVEDYYLIISEPVIPPIAEFEANKTITCDGEISFTDLSLNNISDWSWDFGDGNFSTLQNPTHTYLADGDYDVSLTVMGQFGSDIEIKTNYIEVDLSYSIVDASCTPQTQNYCCDYGIKRFGFDSRVALGTRIWLLNSVSDDAIEGYQDFSCFKNRDIEGGQTYDLTIDNSLNLQDKKVWIDFNNDGSFDNSELVFEAFNEGNSTGDIVIPSTGVVWDIPLRMRVIVDEVGAQITSCTDPVRGQVEDYALRISEPDISSITENNKGNTLLFPNPAKEFFKIVSEKERLVSVEVYNLTGESIIFNTLENVNQNETIVSTDDLSNGTYFAKVLLTNGGTELHKIIITK